MNDADDALDEEVVSGELVGPAGELRPVRAAQPDPLATRPADDILGWTHSPALQRAAIAVSGFLAGAATVALMQRYGSGRSHRALAQEHTDHLLGPVGGLGSGRTFIVHVMPLGPFPVVPASSQPAIRPTTAPK
ncbi:MAG: hypothetical protein ACP5H2_01290 [Solirubrobacteraceae bacterium]